MYHMAEQLDKYELERKIEKLEFQIETLTKQAEQDNKMIDRQADLNCRLEEKLNKAMEALETIKTAATFGRIKGLNVGTPDGMKLKSIANLAEKAIKQIKGEDDND
nr:MAG TPA: hypothetical protein [Caudoviricetes sp.]